MTGDSVRLRVVGQSAEVRASDPAGCRRLAGDWSRCLDTEHVGVEAGAGPPIMVTLADAGPRDAAHYVLTTGLTLQLIGRLSGTRLMLHACGLSDDDGRVLALVAPSGTGKTTAARTLAADGFGYVTDETVVIGDALAVDAYPKPLSFQEQAQGPKVQRGPDELGLGVCAPRLTLARIVMLERRSRPHAPRLTPLALLDGMLALIPQTSALPSLDGPLVRLASTIEACGGVQRLTYHEIDECAGVLGELLSVPDDEQDVSWSVVDAPSADSWALRDGSLRVGTYQDAITVGDEVLVLRHGVPLRLAGIGATLWFAVASGLARDQLEQHVVEAHGFHPEAQTLVSQALSALLDAGALRRLSPLSVSQVLAGESREDEASPVLGSLASRGPG